MNDFSVPVSAEAGPDEVRAAAIERLTFFADAVVAIAITLLALELPLPEGATNAELLRSVAAHRDEYIAFLISFMVVGAHWSGHHRTFGYVTKMGGRLPRLTMYWLLMQVITPFVTRVLTGDGAFQFRFILYASVQTLAGLLFLLMVRDIRRYGLMRPDTPPWLLTHATIRTSVLTAAFLLSIPLSFAGRWAYLCWFLMPLIGVLARRIVARRRAVAAG